MHEQHKWLRSEHKYRIIPLGALTFREMVIRSGEVYHSLLDLPEVTSWVHPLYAIWNAGAHIDNLAPSVYKTLICRLPTDYMQRVQYALRIWYIWQSIPLPEHFKPQDFDEADRFPHMTRADGNEDLPTTRSSIAPSSEAADGAEDDDNDDGEDNDDRKHAEHQSAGHVGRTPRSNVASSNKGKAKAVPAPTPKQKKHKNKAGETSRGTQPGASTDAPGRGGDQREGSRGAMLSQPTESMDAGPSSAGQKREAAGSQRSSRKAGMEGEMSGQQ